MKSKLVESTDQSWSFTDPTTKVDKSQCHCTWSRAQSSGLDDEGKGGAGKNLVDGDDEGLGTRDGLTASR